MPSRAPHTSPEPGTWHFKPYAFPGQNSINIWFYLTDVANIPGRDYADQPRAVPANPAAPEFYLVLSQGNPEYVAHSFDEAKRVYRWLVNQGMSNVRVCAEIKL